MKSISSNQILTVALSFFALLLLATVIYNFTYNPEKKYIKRYQKVIDSAQNNIDSLKIEIIQSDIIIDSLHKEIIIIDNENTILKKKIILIKKEANEKINSVDKFTISELDKFFTDRYSN